MNYIKDLYSKNPQFVREIVKKIFCSCVECDLIEVSHDEELFGENDIMLKMINKLSGCEVNMVLEDFAICYGANYLEDNDERLQKYLNCMAKEYGNEYLQGFHDYRAYERKELVSEFDIRTYNMEAKMAKAIDSVKKKEDNNTL